MFERHLPSTVPLKKNYRKHSCQECLKCLNCKGLKKRKICLGQHSIECGLYINVKFQGRFYIIVKNKHCRIIIKI